MGPPPRDPVPSPPPSAGRSVELAIAGSFIAAIAGAVGFGIAVNTGDRPQYEGLCAFVTLVGLAVGLATWARFAMPNEHDEQEREPLASTPDERATFIAELTTGERILTRRRMLLALLGGGLTAGGLAALLPLRALGPLPSAASRRSGWKAGRRLVTEDGKPVRPGELTTQSAVTVFPEGGADPASSQTVLIRYGGAPFQVRPGREGWTADGCVAYSRVCTHAGCPVGLYQAERHELLCPCHQSVFDVLDGARPTFGPATRSLPQLPLAVDAEGYLVASDDYQEPVGPGFWSRS